MGVGVGVGGMQLPPKFFYEYPHRVAYVRNSRVQKPMHARGIIPVKAEQNRAFLHTWDECQMEKLNIEPHSGVCPLSP